MSTPDRRALVDRGHGELSVRRQCQLLGIARSGIYRLRPAANDDDDPALLRRTIFCRTVVRRNPGPKKDPVSSAIGANSSP